MTTKPHDRQIESDRKLISIIEVLDERHRAGVTEIAEDLDLPKSTVHTHLTTLEQQEYVVKEDSTYRLGFRFLDLGTSVRDRWPGFDLIKEKVDALAATTGERVQFITEEHGYGVYVYRAVGENAVETDSGTGKRVPLNTISAGKAILAFIDPARVEEILAKVGLPKRTANTITDEDELWAELEQVRDDGYARNNEESTRGLRAVGVPIRSPDDRVIGALSVSAPSRRLREEEVEQDVLNQILGAVNELELNIRFS